MQLFYCRNPEKEIILNDLESRHIIKVLRLKKEDSLYLTDGEGYLYAAKIISTENKKCIVSIINKTKKKSHNYYLHIAVSPTKNIDRFEWFLEKSTEIGIDEITPIITTRSEKKIIKEERCNKIIIAAMKQSLKFHKPKLNKAEHFDKFIQKSFIGEKYIAHCHNSAKKQLQNIKTKQDTLILIGPEGDFSEDEITTALKNQYKPISLGESRLRTETAGVIATHIISLK